jgi:superfamily II helicase
MHLIFCHSERSKAESRDPYIRIKHKSYNYSAVKRFLDKLGMTILCFIAGYGRREIKRVGPSFEKYARVSKAYLQGILYYNKIDVEDGWNVTEMACLKTQ